MAKKGVTVEEVTAEMSDDLVDSRRFEVVDIVERVYSSGHQHNCQYRPEINHLGLIYCLTCSIQVGSILPDYIVKLPLDRYEEERERWLHGK